MMNLSSPPLVVESGTQAFVESASQVCRAAAGGDLEQRILVRSDDPHLEEMGLAINALLDSTDAFVRESVATLKAASEGRFYRRFVVKGMPGTFRRGAVTLNEASANMKSKQDLLGEAEARRQQVCAELEQVVSDSSQRIEAILKSINRITLNSKMLAMNAQIEAAHAGEAGRGFGVVGDEMKKMSEQIALAMKGIEDEVDRFKTESSRVVEQIRQAK